MISVSVLLGAGEFEWKFFEECGEVFFVDGIALNF